MSKASEYAAAHVPVPRPAPLRFMNDTQLLGEVTIYGYLQGALCLLSPTQAIAYARWILDTFGEPTDAT